MIIAGPNGSGKSSTYVGSDVETGGRSAWIINPDLLTARIQEVEGLDLREENLKAVKAHRGVARSLYRRASDDRRRDRPVDGEISPAGRTRQRPRLRVSLAYVLLDSPGLNVERVRLRVSKGGHDVPEDRILARHARSLAQMPWFLEQADQAWIYDNSGAVPRLVGTKVGGAVTIDASAPIAVREALARSDLG